jgi:hypothetical protein
VALKEAGTYGHDEWPLASAFEEILVKFLDKLKDVPI